MLWGHGRAAPGFFPFSASNRFLNQVKLMPRSLLFSFFHRMQLEDFQQPGIRSSPGSVSEPGLRGRVPADQNVHDSDELRQGLGSRVQVSL